MRRFAETLQWADDRGFAIHAAVDERLAFIRRTYLLMVVMLCGVALTASVFVRTGLVYRIGPGSMLIGFLALMFLLPKLAAPTATKGQQKLGAVLCTAFYGIACAPLVLFLPSAILVKAFVITTCVFGGLTAYAFTTRKDFSFLGGMLHAGLWIAIGFSVVGLFFGGFGGGASTLLSVGVVVLFCGFVLYDTSNILHHYRVDQHVLAATALMIDFVVLFKHIALLLARLRE